MEMQNRQLTALSKGANNKRRGRYQLKKDGKYTYIPPVRVSSKPEGVTGGKKDDDSMKDLADPSAPYPEVQPLDMNMDYVDSEHYDSTNKGSSYDDKNNDDGYDTSSDADAYEDQHGDDDDDDDESMKHYESGHVMDDYEKGESNYSDAAAADEDKDDDDDDDDDDEDYDNPLVSPTRAMEPEEYGYDDDYYYNDNEDPDMGGMTLESSDHHKTSDGSCKKVKGIPNRKLMIGLVIGAFVILVIVIVWNSVRLREELDDIRGSKSTKTTPGAQAQGGFMNGSLLV